MVFLPHNSIEPRVNPAFSRVPILPNIYDLVAFTLLGGAIALVVHGTSDMSGSLALLEKQPISLGIGHLPEYALRTTLRMFAGILYPWFLPLWLPLSRLKIAGQGKLLFQQWIFCNQCPFWAF